MVKKTHFWNSYYFLLLIIVIVAALLRFWDYGNIQFMHDELSALFRLQYDSLGDVIRYGVIEGDTHPAGVQIFLYYWTMIFGFSEMAVKLPFIVAGLLSIVIVYEIAKIWFDDITGLFSAVMLASTQFFVMYSQTARPYISGLFLTLMMVYFWSLYFFRKRKVIYLVFYVLFAALSAYNHHFSLLFAALVGITGIFLIDRKTILPYFLSGITIFVLYIPHLPIFFAQLNKGGIGYWLQKPDPAFFTDFLSYLIHYSYILLIIVIGVIIVLLFTGKQVSFRKQLSKRLILLIWFITPILIGYIYSVLVNPVIQYSMLIFSTPYIYIVLFSFHRKVPHKVIRLLVFVLLVANVLTLIYQRQHYKVYYHQPYEELFKTALLENDNVTVIDDCVGYYHEYYFNKFSKEAPFITKKDIGEGLCVFDSVVSAIKTDYVVTHALTGEELSIVKQYFPYQKGYKDGFTYEIYTFCRKPEKGTKESESLVTYDNLTSKKGNWKDLSDYIVCDSTEDTYYYIDNQEWGPAIELSFDTILKREAGIIDFSAQIKLNDESGKVLLVIAVTDSDKETIRWKGINIAEYCPEKDIWTKVTVSSDMHGVILNRSYDDKTIIKANVWNVSKKPVKVKDLKLTVRPLNKMRYNLY